MSLLWIVDRASALVAYPALFLAVLTGIFYASPRFGLIHDAARRVHVEIAVFAGLVTLLHGAVGTLDALTVVSGSVPPPALPRSYVAVAALVGAGALLLVAVAVAGFVDAARFDGEWTPRAVHGFAYVGFGFATIHAVAVGSDVGATARTAMLAVTLFLVYALVLRGLVERGVVGPPGDAGEDGGDAADEGQHRRRADKAGARNRGGPQR